VWSGSRAFALFASFLFLQPAWAQEHSTAKREPVLGQIDLPEPYYFREMYLPQPTSGPSSAAWMPDSRTLVFSMAGSLWRQQVGTETAQQLTAGPGYDYQPDCSPDGRWIVYVSYADDAMELWALDVQTMRTRQLTSGGAVNAEPRFSPDGKRIVFVSTSYNKRFHIFAGDFARGELSNVQRITGEDKSPLPRYYYSEFDTEISPVWSRDGSEILYVSNRGHLYGSGGFWRMKAAAGEPPREIHYEETNWKARPELSPEGKRVVYASYLGRQWHQLWTMPADGGDAFQLTYGDYDNINPRWSPDATRIAFISNRTGNTSLWILDLPGGKQTSVVIKNREYLKPTARIKITALDPEGHITPARVSVTGEDGRAYAPDNAWMQADDSFVRRQQRFEAHYFESRGSDVVTVPAGRVAVQAMKGFEYRVEEKTVEAKAGEEVHLVLHMRALDLPREPGFHWVSGDVHVHMNYGGEYRNTPQHMVQQAESENLSIVENLIVNKEQRIPDIAYFRPDADPASTATTLLFHGQEFHTSYWGHIGLLNLEDHFLLPGYAGYSNTSVASAFPPNANVIDLAHEQHALAGYVHPYEEIPDPRSNLDLRHALPVDVALGKVDYLEVLGFSDHLATTSVWYRLLNLGFHLPAAAGTDAMSNLASLRGPVGLNRVYARVPDGKLAHGPWLDSLKHGHTFATNGPLLGFTLAGKLPGDELRLPAGGRDIQFSAWLRSFVPVDHLQVVCNGKVVRELELDATRENATVAGSLPPSTRGWCLLRALAEQPEMPVLDAFPYATTSPLYLSGAGSKLKSPEDAQFFLAWIDHMLASTESNPNWNTPAEKTAVLDILRRARAVYEAKLK
jgi:TolB protein